MAKRFLNQKIKLITVSLLACASLANAEEASVFNVNAKLGFFNHDSVADLNQPLEYTNQQEIQMGPTKGFDLSSDFKVNKDLNSKDPMAANAPANEQEKVPEGVDPQEYALRKEFGDPSVPVQVKGTDTAPAPYKAMLKSIEMGRDDLALQYAEQWMGYMKSLERVTKKAASMSQIAGLKADQLEVAINTDSVDNIDPAGLQKYLEIQKRREQANSNFSTTQLEQKDKQIIDAFFGEGDSGQKDPSNPINKDSYANLVDKNIDETSRRAMIRAELANKLPHDPKGLVKILYFLKASDPQDLMTGREITTVLSSASLNVPVSVVPLSVEPISATSSVEFMNNTGLPAKLRDGVALSRSLNISQTPALVFSTTNSDKVFIKSGLADSVFIEEVCRIIGGK